MDELIGVSGRLGVWWKIMKRSPYLWELAAFLFAPMASQYDEGRYSQETVWWMYYFTFILLYLILFLKDRLILEVSLKKVIRGYLLCLGGYLFFSVLGVYNVFDPVDLPILLFTFGYFFVKYRLFHLLFRRHKLYEPYMALSRLYQHIGRAAYLPSFPLKSKYITFRNSSVFMIEDGVLNLTELDLYSLPSDWLEKVPPHIWIIDLSENFLATLGIKQEAVSKFMERLPDNTFVVVNFVGNPLEEKVVSPDFFHPRLLILSEPNHEQIAFHLIEKGLQVTLSDEEKELCESDGWEEWGELFFDLEKKRRLAFAWKRGLHVLSLPQDRKKIELRVVGILLKVAYVLEAHNLNTNMEAPHHGETSAKLENT